MSEGEPNNCQDELGELLKRCSVATLDAALKFRQKGDLSQIEVIVMGIIDRHLEPEQREIFKNADDGLRIYEELGLDSLTMLEIVMLVEQTLQLSIENEELRELRTIGDVKYYLDAKVRGVELPLRPKIFSVEEVASVMPHREPFLFLQEITVDGVEARGQYKITGNEYFLEGHFKENPVFPASIMIEALGQLCVFFLIRGSHSGLTTNVNPASIFFAACDGIKCRRICKPGDVLSMAIRVEHIRHPLACFSGEIFVDGQKSASAQEIKLAFDFYPLVDGSNETSGQIESNSQNGVGRHGFLMPSSRSA